MGASCNVQQSVLSELKGKGITDNVRVILQPYTFYTYNKTKTGIANTVYGLDLKKGEMLFTLIPTPNKNYIAEPNKSLFQRIQEVKDKFLIKIATKPLSKHNLDPDGPIKEYDLKDDEYAELDSLGLSTRNFLDNITDKDVFDTHVKIFAKKLGGVYNPNDKSDFGNENKNLFYKYLAAKGFSGLVINDKAFVFNYDINQVKKEIESLSRKSLTQQLSLFEESEDKTELVPTTQAMNELEKLGTYSGEEMTILKSLYSDSEIDEMVINDLADAKAIFNEFLYNELWKKSTFVSRDMINDFNRICK